jgi:molybdenum cofactor cytidylyltransferase
MIAAVILAAGNSSRMGKPKALLTINNSTFLNSILNRARISKYRNIIVVLGQHYELVEKSILPKGAYDVIRNQHPEHGQLSSLQLALRCIKEDIKGTLVALVDHPMVSEKTYRLIFKKANEQPGSIIIPTFRGRKGHPVYFSRKFFAELLKAPLDQGARYVVSNNESEVIYVPVDDAGIITDIDTPEQYVQAAKANFTE